MAIDLLIRPCLFSVRRRAARGAGLLLAAGWTLRWLLLPVPAASAAAAASPAPAALTQQDDDGPPLGTGDAAGNPNAAGNPDAAYANVAVFTRVLQLIRQDYVDDRKTDYHDLIYNALRGMLSGLDPHSQFMEPTSFKDMQEDTNSRYDGLGLNVAAKESGVLVIVSTIEDTPASRAGLMGGDEIRKINGQSTDKLPLTDAITALKGKPGESVVLTILRPTTKEVRDFTLVRTEIRVDSVRDAHLLDPAVAGGFRVGYARIVQFNLPTAEELNKRLDELQKQGMEALVLDLRNNPGGVLTSAVDVCGQFVPPNTLVASTIGRTPSSCKDYRTAGNARARGDFPLAVLINNGSASGAEIVAGALKDLHRAVLVGERTFGKGSVQSVIQLPDGSGVRLTTAKYYTPSKQVIHEHGVEPTIRVTLSAEQERNLAVRRNGDAPAGGSPDEHDPQLERATDALKGMIIYRQQLAAMKTGK